MLVAGPSGSGKSTTTLACLEAGLGYLGDDYVLLDVDEPSVHSLYSTAKLEPDNLHRFPELAPLVANPDRLDSQKAMLFLHEHRPEQLVLHAPVGAILLPRIAHTSRTTLAPAPASAAMSALAPTTLFQLPGYGREVARQVQPPRPVGAQLLARRGRGPPGDRGRGRGPPRRPPMTAALPMVSVVIPVFDAGGRLLEAIVSVERQHYEPLEIVVVDDGSTDDTPAVIASLGTRVRSLRQPNAGPAAARNRGLAAARGELFAFLDADDLWPDGKLQRQVAALEADPDLDLVLGRVSYLPESGGVLARAAVGRPGRADRSSTCRSAAASTGGGRSTASARSTRRCASTRTPTGSSGRAKPACASASSTTSPSCTGSTTAT